MNSIEDDSLLREKYEERLKSIGVICKVTRISTSKKGEVQISGYLTRTYERSLAILKGSYIDIDGIEFEFFLKN